jgi:uncharacterized ion transporter superfamily protein YfcC
MQVRRHVLIAGGIEGVPRRCGSVDAAINKVAEDSKRRLA